MGKLKLFVLIAVLLSVFIAAVASKHGCGTKTTVTTIDQKTEKKVDDKLVQHDVVDTHKMVDQNVAVKTDNNVVKDVDVSKKVVVQKTTVKKPDGTVTETETDTTTYEKKDKSQQHQDTDKTSVTQVDLQQHADEQKQVEHHEDTKTELHKVTTVKSGGGNGALSAGFFLNQDLRSTFHGKLSPAAGAFVGLDLIGPTSVGASIETTGDFAISGSVKNVSIYLHQDVGDLVHGNFHPVPGLGFDYRVIGPLGVAAGIDTSLNGYFGITVRAF